MPIIWDPIYSVHVEIIDQQHQRFVGIINELDSAIRAQKIRDELGGIFKELIEYAKLHFATEEMYFEKFHYEDAQAHIEAHASLLKKTDELYTRFLTGDYDVSNELIEFLLEWFTHHTASMDKGYTQCFHEHGLY
jgi:hemerythrin-like metal-binding protein